MTNDPAGRFFIIEGSPPDHPGKCMVCGGVGGDGRKFIDFGHHQDWYGRVYFCSFCFEEVCSYLGWMSPVNSDNLAEQVIEMDSKVCALKEENDNLRDLVNSRISQLRTDLDSFLPKSEVVKKSPGRPKKAEPGTS